MNNSAILPTTGQEDTVGRLVRRNCEVYPNWVAMEEKDLGIWQRYTWADVYRRMRNIGLGFLCLGLKKGDRVVIIGNNDPEIFWIEWGIQAIGGVAICCYVDALPDEIKYFINHSEAKFFVAEDQEQVDKLLRIKDDCPSIQKAIYWDNKGLWFYKEQNLMQLGDLERLGEKYHDEHPKYYEDCVVDCKGSDLAVIMYSSGTTGLPKGIMHTNRTILEYALQGFQKFPIKPGDRYVSYSSPAWGEQFVGLTIGAAKPLAVFFAEEPETVQKDIREAAPYFLFYPPRLWEDMAKQVQVKIMDASPWKRAIYDLSMKISYKTLEYKEKSRPVPLHWKIADLLADICLQAIRDHLGLIRNTVYYAGGGMIAPDLARFFRALRIPLCAQYAISETGILAGSSPEDYVYDAIGQPLPGVEIRIADKNEIHVRSNGLLIGYWNNKEAYDKKVNSNGWFLTGDAGWISTENGMLSFWDRIEELMPLKTGYFSPQFLEIRLRFSPYIKDAIVFGGESGWDYISSIIGIDFDMVGKWAEMHSIAYTTLVELSQLPPVLKLINEEVARINKTVPEASRISKFIVLHKEFDPDEGEMTRSRKLKRNVLRDRFAELLDAMYGDKQSINLKAPIVYKDGRKGIIEAHLVVNTVQDAKKC